MNSRILVVDDQVSFCQHIQAILQREGHHVVVANNAEQALDALTSRPFDILLTDMKMPGTDGLELFKMAEKIDPDISGIIMTAFGSIESAVTSIKQGMSDYLQKPFDPELLLMTVDKVLREKRMLKEIRDLRKEIDQKYAFGNIIGKNHEMQKIYELIQKLAPTDARVLITGETGVGKELVAKAIHFNSPRKEKPFVGINCAALAENLLESELFGYEKGAFTGAFQTKTGKFEYAQGGTIFLDEVGDISPNMQVKLLRVLQEKKFERVGGNDPIDVDVRIISATNQNLEEKIEKKEFRVDLFYRLNVFFIRVPPLRERIEDIPLLAKHFINALNKTLGKNIKCLSNRAMHQLMEHHWPGNVRELENVLERAFYVTDRDTIDQVTFSRQIQTPAGELSWEMPDADIPFMTAKSIVLKRFEKAYFSEALKRYQGNVSKTAKQTRVNRRTIWRKIKAYGLDGDRSKPKEDV
ncbi:MAG: sigma-54-dependent Fis family transcriptional regulator [Desulfobacteraceae bacterium]|nr:MAG: sigma-54-dependent Fis family transcriptional regulator [Desulfobacteraceae bacterium]